jgi:hypothetical protein
MACPAERKDQDHPNEDSIKVNTEMLALYWEIGKELTEKQEQSNW